METKRMEVSIVNVELRPVHYGRGLISVIDTIDGETEYLFSVNVVAESEEKATAFFHEVGSQQFPHIRWYIEQIRRKGSPADSEHEVEVDEAVLMAGILSASIQQLHEGDFEGTGIPVNTSWEQAITHSGTFRLYFEVVTGTMSISVDSQVAYLGPFTDELQARRHLVGQYTDRVTLYVTNARLLTSSFNYIVEDV
jgi:hypothetical protein